MDFDAVSVKELLDRYHQTKAHFETAARSVPPDKFDSPPAPGKWTARQIICHLGDCEAVAAWRYRMIIAQPGSTLTAFDQEKWEKELGYGGQSWEDALRAYTVLRWYNLEMLRRLPVEAWSRVAMHEERGENSLFRLVKHNAEHVENHAQQVRNIARKFAGAAAG